MVDKIITYNYILILLMFTNNVLASEKNIGLLVGVNYFKKNQIIKYTPIDINNSDKGGKLLYDNSGLSFNIGIKYFITNHMGLFSEYRSSRKSSYSYPKTWTPWVWGTNTYWVKTNSSSIRLGLILKVFKLYSTYPSLITGYEYVKLEAWSREGHIRGDTGTILYTYPKYPNFYYHGVKFLNGYFLATSIQRKVYNNIYIDLAGSYTITYMKKWKSYNDVNQDLSGFYISLNLLLLVY